MGSFAYRLPESEVCLGLSRIVNRRMEINVEGPLQPPAEEILAESPGANEPEGGLQDDSRPYSCFSPRQKTCISSMASFSAMFSGLSSFIYYPSITAISRSLHVSVELINLTITSYQVVSYFSANMGLALQNSYSALVVLRCVQSAGASSTSLQYFVPRT